MSALLAGALLLTELVALWTAPWWMFVLIDWVS